MSICIDSRLIGKTIKTLRQSRGWTQHQLADIVGYSVRTIRRIENDGTESITVVNAFAEIFGVSALDILNGDVFYCSNYAFCFLCISNHLSDIISIIGN